MTAIARRRAVKARNTPRSVVRATGFCPDDDTPQGRTSTRTRTDNAEVEKTTMHEYGSGWGMGFGWIWMIVILVLAGLAIGALIKYLRK